MPAGLINRSARRSHELKSAKVHPVEKPDKPAAPPRPLAHTSSELFTTNREYFRGGSRLRHALTLNGLVLIRRGTARSVAEDLAGRDTHCQACDAAAALGDLPVGRSWRRVAPSRRFHRPGFGLVVEG